MGESCVHVMVVMRDVKRNRESTGIAKGKEATGSRCKRQVNQCIDRHYREA